MGLAPTDALVGVAIAGPRDELLAWTQEQEGHRVPAKQVPTAGRDRKGSRLPGLAPDARPAGLTRASE
jgi:hypothetical protein